MVLRPFSFLWLLAFMSGPFENNVARFAKAGKPGKFFRHISEYFSGLDSSNSHLRGGAEGGESFLETSASLSGGLELFPDDDEQTRVLGELAKDKMDEESDETNSEICKIGQDALIELREAYNGAGIECGNLQEDSTGEVALKLRQNLEDKKACDDAFVRELEKAREQVESLRKEKMAMFIERLDASVRLDEERIATRTAEMGEAQAAFFKSEHTAFMDFDSRQFVATRGGVKVSEDETCSKFNDPSDGQEEGKWFEAEDFLQADEMGTFRKRRCCSYLGYETAKPAGCIKHFVRSYLTVAHSPSPYSSQCRIDEINRFLTHEHTLQLLGESMKKHKMEEDIPTWHDGISFPRVDPQLICNCGGAAGASALAAAGPGPLEMQLLPRLKPCLGYSANLSECTAMDAELLLQDEIFQRVAALQVQREAEAVEEEKSQASSARPKGSRKGREALTFMCNAVCAG